MSGLLATKLRLPSIPQKRVRRSQISQKFYEGLALNRQVTLVSAPAGFGKTTCVSEWVNALEDWAVAWLSLDPLDDDPERFFAYFIAALQKLNANLGQEIEGVIRSGQLPPSEIINATLITDLMACEGRLLLVLDDFHVIQDHFILQVLEQLLANFPDLLHLVLVTREDPPLPLARLRANNQLTEIRARDLRFSRGNIDHFLKEVIGVSLSQVDIAVLEDKTEGWIVGVQLAALSVRDRTDPSGFIANLSGSHRFILSYLTEQVLNQQPEEIQHFLLQTAFLDRLNGDLCNTVTGRSDSVGLLEKLYQANLFLVSLDDEGQWYRYHHLFADLLRNLQTGSQKEKTTELHRRASRWYAGAGMVNEAIQHALAAEDYAMAVSLLENHAMEMVMQGYAKTVNTWVQALPEEWDSHSPRTNLAFAWMHLLRGEYPQVSLYLERLEKTFSTAELNTVERQSIKAEWLVMQALRMNMEGKMPQSLAAAEEALRILPEGDNRVRSLAHFCRASAHQAMDDYNLAVEAFQRAIQYGRASGNFIAEMMSISGLAQLAFEHGQLHLAHEIVAPVSTQLDASGSLPPISTGVFGILGEINYQWVQNEKARSYYRRALQLSTLGGYNSGIVNCRVLLSRLAQLEGDLETAAFEIQQAAEMLQMDTPGYVRQETIAQQVKVYLGRKRLDAAELVLQGQGFYFRDQFSYPDLKLKNRLSYSNGLLCNSSLSVLLYQARTRHDLTGFNSGIDLASQLIVMAFESQSTLTALEALLLRAQLHELMRDNQASLADYATALKLAEPAEFIGVFIEQGPPVAAALRGMVRQNQLGTISLEYVERILDAFPKLHKSHDELPDAQQPPRDNLDNLVEPLTEREMEVLRLVVAGLKYKDIAENLFISLNTVRFHVKAIYGKLNVNNRVQAIARARKLHIL